MCDRFYLFQCNDAEALRKVEHKAMYMRMIPQFSPKKRDENKSKKVSSRKNNEICDEAIIALSDNFLPEVSELFLVKMSSLSKKYLRPYKL